ncbi:EamA family transporter [Massilia oculi]|uniref:EamA family transporter n=1 Tax=Massilia hydrophila TaxID=3044279 RepID=A0ABS7YGZ3_9BURK|nr:EamA family transporter [Massilia oculi]MCA1857514.1 EamA family transporter [Massilia oculi]
MVSVNAGAAWAKGLFPLVGSQGVTALRVGLAALVMLAVVRPWRTPPARADMRNLLVYGLMLGCMNLLIYAAFARIPIGIAVAIEVVGPLAVVVLSSRRARDVGWVLLAAGGLWLLAPVHAGVPPLDPVGVAYALGAAFCWAMYIVFGKRVSTLDGGQAVAWGMLAAALFTVPLGAAHAGAALLLPSVLAGGLAVALLSSALPYTLEMAALRRLPRRVFGILVSAGPAFAALAGWIVLGERLTGLQWLAILLVIVACGGAAATASRPA